MRLRQLRAHVSRWTGPLFPRESELTLVHHAGSERLRARVMLYAATVTFDGGVTNGFIRLPSRAIEPDCTVP